MNQLKTERLLQLSDGDFHDMVVDLLTEISMLTGAIVHSEHKMLIAQVNTIQLFLRSSYRFMNLTIAEVRQAFYLNAQGELDEVHKHYNKPINGEFIGGVLSSYCKYTASLNQRIPEILSKVKAPEVKKPYTPTIKEWHYAIQTDYEYYKLGDVGLIFVPYAKYYYLRSVGLIFFRNKSDYARWYARACRHRRNKIMAKPATTDAQRIAKDKARRLYDIIESQYIVPLSEDKLIMHEMRKLLYIDLLSDLQAIGINNIFNEIKITEQQKI